MISNYSFRNVWLKVYEKKYSEPFKFHSKNVCLILGSLSGFWSRLNQWKNSPTATVELRMEMIFTEIVITCGCQQICWLRAKKFRGSINKHIHLFSILHELPFVYFSDVVACSCATGTWLQAKFETTRLVTYLGHFSGFSLAKYYQDSRDWGQPYIL